MKVSADLSEYRAPRETFDLLRRWGRSQMLGQPHLGYPSKCPSCSEYLAPRSKEDLPPKFDMSEFERLCWIIDNNLSFPRQEALKCCFRYTMPDGSRWSKRHSAAFLGVRIDEYELLLRAAMRAVDVLLNGDNHE